LNQQESKEKCQKRNQTGFNIKLKDQLFTKEPTDFRMLTSFALLSDLAVLRFIKIDTGQQQNKNTYDPNNQRIEWPRRY